MTSYNKDGEANRIVPKQGSIAAEQRLSAPASRADEVSEVRAYRARVVRFSCNLYPVISRKLSGDSITVQDSDAYFPSVKE
jgi:hypothetical protein